MIYLYVAHIHVNNKGWCGILQLNKPSHTTAMDKVAPKSPHNTKYQSKLFVED